MYAIIRSHTWCVAISDLNQTLGIRVVRHNRICIVLVLLFENRSYLVADCVLENRRSIWNKESGLYDKSSSIVGVCDVHAQHG